MRHSLNRALDTHPDYPPGFRPGDFEPRDLPQENWNHGCTLIHTHHSRSVWLRLMELHRSLITLEIF